MEKRIESGASIVYISYQYSNATPIFGKAIRFHKNKTSKRRKALGIKQIRI